MNKILLVYDDYAELMSLETALKKVGFDVIGLSNEYLLGDQIVGFNPDLVVTSGKGGKVNTLGVGKKLKEMPRWQGKSILIFAPGVKPQPQDLLKIRVDMVLESPVPAQRLLQVVAKLLEKDEAILTERLGRALADGTEDIRFVSSGGETGEPTFIQGRSEEDVGRPHFKFGDRMNVSEKSEIKEQTDNLFGSVDMDALESELLGTKEPVAPRFDLSRERSSEADSSEPHAGSLASQVGADLTLVAGYGGASEEVPRAALDLKKANEALKRKADRYNRVAKQTELKRGKGSVSRVESKKAQKALSDEWSPEELETQDEMRRAFAKAMFKK